MLKAFAFLQNFLTEPMRRDDRGVTSVEYAMLLVLVVAGLFVAVGAFTGYLSTIFNGFKF